MTKQKKTKLIAFLFIVASIIVLWVVLAPNEDVITKETVSSEARYNDDSR